MWSVPWSRSWLRSALCLLRDSTESLNWWGPFLWSSRLQDTSGHTSTDTGYPLDRGARYWVWKMAMATISLVMNNDGDGMILPRATQYSQQWEPIYSSLKEPWILTNVSQGKVAYIHLICPQNTVARIMVYSAFMYHSCIYIHWVCTCLLCNILVSVVHPNVLMGCFLVCYNDIHMYEYITMSTDWMQ